MPKRKTKVNPAYPRDEGPLSKSQMIELQKDANELLPTGKVISFKSLVDVVPKVANPSSTVR